MYSMNFEPGSFVVPPPNERIEDSAICKHDERYAVRLVRVSGFEAGSADTFSVRLIDTEADYDHSVAARREMEKAMDAMDFFMCLVVSLDPLAQMAALKAEVTA